MRIKKIGLQLAVVFLAFTAQAQNPIIQTIYTADPAPMVHNDTVYLYTSHDEDNSTWFTMNDWRCYSSTDMVNWTDRGSPLSLKTFSWANKDAWAAQCIPRNGKFYFYVPVNHRTMGMSIGVGVSDSPTGPFTDPLDKPLVHSGHGDIDPSVFIDDDGQAYLYWGNPYLKYVKLNEDMISYSGDVVEVPLNREGFHVRYKDTEKRPSAYEEAPWFYKRNNLYYMLYAAGGVPEHLAYSTSSSPTGPWQYRDTIMSVITKGGAFTNHPAVLDYKGKSYLFYHNGALPGGGGFNRSVCVEEFEYNADGTIPRIASTAEGVRPVGNLNPYQRQEAETIAWEVGVETESSAEAGGLYVTDIDNGDYVKVRSVDFKEGAKRFEANVASVGSGAIEVRLGGADGALLGICEVSSTGGMQVWKTISAKMKKVKGIHELYFVFKGGDGNLFNFNWWRFN